MDSRRFTSKARSTHCVRQSLSPEFACARSDWLVQRSAARGRIWRYRRRVAKGARAGDAGGQRSASSLDLGDDESSPLLAVHRPVTMGLQSHSQPLLQVRTHLATIVPASRETFPFGRSCARCVGQRHEPCQGRALIPSDSDGGRPPFVILVRLSSGSLARCRPDPRSLDTRR